MPPSNTSTRLPSSSFTTSRLNNTTFLIQEHDAYREQPFIYVKLHPKYPVIVLSDTGCDEPDAAHKKAKFTHLRAYIENFPLPCNNDKPLNPDSRLKYFIICTHCHYDHIGGISQFLEGGTTQIIASAAGRDFIEDDEDDSHSLHKFIGKPKPFYYVTHWAKAFEQLYWTVRDRERDVVLQFDLGIVFVQQPGHTPDSLAWYDRSEMWLYVGDTLYESSGDGGGESIVFPPDGNLVEWVVSLRKLLVLVRSENAKAEEKAAVESSDEGWEMVAKRVRLGAGHVTHSADAEEIIKKVDQFFYQILQKKIPVVKKEYRWNDAYYTWTQEGWGLSMRAPPRLVDQARDFFNIYGPEDDGGEAWKHV